jgi:EAL domain-containing protein (putative c-di-GMP-specific phosphodiesterase class I)
MPENILLIRDDPSDAKAVREGVESPEQLAFLKQQICPEGQGYYFSQPLPALAFAQLLEHGTTDR